MDIKADIAGEKAATLKYPAFQNFIWGSILVLEESLDLAKSCFHVLRKDKEMLVYPLILTALMVLHFTPTI